LDKLNLKKLTKKYNRKGGAGENEKNSRDKQRRMTLFLGSMIEGLNEGDRRRIDYEEYERQLNIYFRQDVREAHLRFIDRIQAAENLTRYLTERIVQDNQAYEYLRYLRDEIILRIIEGAIVDYPETLDSAGNFIDNHVIQIRQEIDEISERQQHLLGGKRKTRRNRKGGFLIPDYDEKFRDVEQAKKILTRHIRGNYNRPDNRRVVRVLVNFLKYYIEQVWSTVGEGWTRRDWENDIKTELIDSEENLMGEVSSFYQNNNEYDYEGLLNAWTDYKQEGGKKRKSRKSKKGKKRLTKRHRK
jgi:hypothetical protein